MAYLRSRSSFGNTEKVKIRAPALVEALVPVSSGPRDALRQAHEARRLAEGEVVRRREVSERVRQHLSAIEAERDTAAEDGARFDDEAAKGWVLALEHGRDVAEPAGLSDVSVAQRHRDEAQSALNQAQAAMAFIEAGVQEAEAVLAKAQRDELEAAEAVLIAHGLGIADRLAELEAEQEELRAALKGLDRVWLSEPAVPVPRAVALPARLRGPLVASQARVRDPGTQFSGR